MNEINLSNKNGIPIITVGELKELLTPFTDECPVTPISVFYVGSGTKGAELAIRPSNTQIHMDTKPCKRCPDGITTLSLVYVGKKFCQFCGRALSQ